MDIAAARAEPSTKPGDWTPARLYLLLSGVWLVITGISGLLVDHSFPIGSDAVAGGGTAEIFGVFLTNGWHSLAGLASGVLCFALLPKPEWARAGALWIGAIFVVTTLGLLLLPPETFWLASDTADQIVHATLAIGGIAAGSATPRALDRLPTVP